MIGLEIPILFLEDYASGGTIFCIVEWGDFEAEVFSYETNWYIGTIARKNWCSIHGLFFTIQSVGGFTDGHNDFGVAYSVGYALSFLIPVNFSAKCFAEYAEWNHGSPSIVYIWSSVAFNNCVVDEVIGRTDGHNDGAASVFINFTEGVSQGCAIDFAIVSFNSYNYIYSTFLIAFEEEFALTIAYGVVNIEVNASSFVALRSDVGGHGTVNLRNVAIFVNNGNSYNVVAANFAFNLVECESFSKVVLNNSQFLFNVLTSDFIVSFYGDGGTNKRFVSRDICIGIKLGASGVHACNSIAIYAKAHVSNRSVNSEAIFVNINRVYSYALAKSNLIVYSVDSVTIDVAFAINSYSIHFKVNALNSAKFSEGELSNSNILTAVVQGNINNIVARYEISSTFVAYISEGVSRTVPIENEIVSFQGRSRIFIGCFWSRNDADIVTMVCA